MEMQVAMKRKKMQTMKKLENIVIEIKKRLTKYKGEPIESQTQRKRETSTTNEEGNRECDSFHKNQRGREGEENERNKNPSKI